ncbi:MAG: 50S ribosomal protein L33 [Planctomycetes bacterium RBG_16_59_8]|nr:MAG: 50S ribosomal protein L33 [Planctomycetes bacterium RBG_16_59_8]
MREWIFLECTACGTRYYRTTKNTTSKAKLELKKFCGRCRKRTPHKERKK